MKIISVHLPKTAGSSFRFALESAFGGQLIKAYQGSGIGTPMYEHHQETLQQSLLIAEQELPSNACCIHGHFLPARYLLLKDKEPLNFVTWMREPIARMFSHYNYWQQSYNPTTSAPHHKLVIEENWSLEKFCLSEKFRNIYAQYLWAFPLEYFSFIGITEHYETDLACFSDHFLSESLEPVHTNTSKNTVKHKLDSDFIKEIELFHAEDIKLYQRALEMRKERLNKANQ